MNYSPKLEQFLNKLPRLTIFLKATSILQKSYLSTLNTVVNVVFCVKDKFLIVYTNINF